MTPILATLAICLAPVAAATCDAAEIAISLDANGLEDLGDGWAYEGWLIIDEVPISTGTFTVDTAGLPSRSDFTATLEDPGTISAFVLTIEPSPDPDPAPSPVHLLAGDIVGGTAELSVGHRAALADGFSSASGQYILAAPSGGDDSEYVNGIWWLDPEGAPDPGLDLPALPAGWVYEGWVVGPGGPMSTGRFTTPSGADGDGAGLTSGPYGSPPFPGQDLLNPPVDLTDGFAAVITIEPQPDTSPAPFTLKPLVDASIDDVGAMVLQGMENMAASFPTGSVTILGSPVTAELAYLQLDATNLGDVGPDFVYEGWLIAGGPISTGRFSVAGGVPSQSYFPTEVGSLADASAFVLTIEPAVGDDPAPSQVHLLAGDLVHGEAAATIDHMAALGTDLSQSTGMYILATPSSGGSAPYRNGIWWLEQTAGGPMPALSLPMLPEGWVYEGWVAGSEGPISTGRFLTPSEEDSDGTGPAAGPEDGPPFPGQDFVDPPRDLTSGYAAVITVEPEPDTGPAPFFIKPLRDPSIDDVGEGTLQPMHYSAEGIPSARALLLDPLYIAAAAHTGGINETVWRTDLDLQNSTPRQQRVVIELLRSDDANLAPPQAILTLAPQASAHAPDVVATLFDTVGVGALRVLAEQGALRVSSRTYNDAGAGTFGQGIPAAGRRDTLGFGDVGRLVGLSESGDTGFGYRTNVGLVNLTLASVMVDVDLFGADGSHLGRVTRELAPFEHTQINGIFPEPVEGGYAEVRTGTPGGLVLAYGSVVDNLTGDPAYVAVR